MGEGDECQNCGFAKSVQGIQLLSSEPVWQCFDEVGITGIDRKRITKTWKFKRAVKPAVNLFVLRSVMSVNQNGNECGRHWKRIAVRIPREWVWILDKLKVAG